MIRGLKPTSADTHSPKRISGDARLSSRRPRGRRVDPAESNADSLLPLLGLRRLPSARHEALEAIAIALEAIALEALEAIAVLRASPCGVELTLSASA
jgi:hypothetical protein